MSISELFEGEEEKAKEIEAVKEIVELLLTGDINQLSDLNEREVNDFARMLAYAETFGFELQKRILLYKLKLRVSQKRKGRQELVNVIKYLAAGFLSEREREPIIKKLFRVR